MTLALPPATDLAIWRVSVHDMVLAIFVGAYSDFMNGVDKADIERYLNLTTEVVGQAAAMASGGAVRRTDFADVVMAVATEMRAVSKEMRGLQAIFGRRHPASRSPLANRTIEMGELAELIVRDIYGYLDDSVKTGKDEVKSRYLVNYVACLIRGQIIFRCGDGADFEALDIATVKKLHDFVEVAVPTVLNDGVRRHNEEAIAANGGVAP